MIKKKIVFIILHYMAVETTFECIKHIMDNIDTDSYQIVVVDNNSPDDSYDLLYNKYQKERSVDLIHCEENLGFSRGNNLGIRYARQKYETEFLVVMNNDAFMLETLFLKKVEMYYGQYHFSVAGPRVVDKYGVSSNPVADDLPSIDIINKRVAHHEKMLRLNRLHLMMIYYRYKNLRMRLERCNKIIRNREKKKINENEVKQDVVLHGCFWIFSNDFFREYEGLTEKKALFAEEETLLYMLRQKHLVSIFLPDILVIHMEDASTNAAYKELKKRLLFISKNQIETWKEYVEMMGENE